MLKSIPCFIFVLLTASLSAFPQNANVAVPPRDIDAKAEPLPEKTPESRIRGRVIYEDTGKPVRRAEIVLLSTSELTQDYYTKSQTDGNGEFVMSHVRAGSYYPMIDVPGILNPLSYKGFFGMSGDDPQISAAKLDLFFKKIVSTGGGDLEVVILAKRAGAIGGRVQYADGDPAAGIRVEALRKATDGFEERSEEPGRPADVGVTNTDDRGIYRFVGLPPGEYIVYILEKVVHTPDSDGEYDYSLGSDRERRSQLRTYYPDVSEISEAKLLEIAVGGQQEGINITIPERKLFELSGTVISKADKKPVVSANINFERINGKELLVGAYRVFSRTISTNAAGEWTVKNLPAGNYRVQIFPPYVYEEPGSVNLKKSPKFAPVTEEIKIADESPDKILTELPFESVLLGTVVVEGGKVLPRSFSIFALHEGKSSPYAADTIELEEDEKKVDFRIDGVSSGANSILLYLHNDPAFYVKSVRKGSIDLTKTTLQVQEGEELKGIEVVLSDKPGVIKVKFAEGDDKLDFPRIVIVPVGKTPVEMQSLVRILVPNENGETEKKMTPGEYIVRIFMEHREGEPVDDWQKKQAEIGKKVTIREGEITSVTLEIPKK
jgi:hypothetical protein